MQIRLLSLALLPLTPVTSAAADFTHPQAVIIEGYDDHAMEPFLSRDGRILLFNNSNDPPARTDLHWAERKTPTLFRYRGRVEGANSNMLDGVPTMDKEGLLYFVSVRSYEQSLSTIYRGRFANGRVSHVELVPGISRLQRGDLNFDIEVSADGTRLYGVDGVFRGGSVPEEADIFVAERSGNCFKRLPGSAAMMANVNTSALEYAAAISEDELELFFTRMSGALFWRKLKILRATRPNRNVPFGRPRVIKSIKCFVEAPTLGDNGRALYYHEKVNGRYRISRVTR